KYYGKLSFSSADPAADSLAAERWKRYNLVTLRWQAIRDRAGSELVPPGTGTAAIVVMKDDRFRTIPLIEVFNVPLFGTQYRLADLETLGERIGEAVDDVIDINKKIGYLADHGTPPLQGGQMFPGQQGQDGLTNFNRIISENYSIVEVRLADGPIPDGIDCLVIAGPREPFNDWELFQIDQFLMRGRSLAVFYDAFDEMQMPQGQQQRGPMFLPVDTGLEKLLDHYGATVKRSYVLDTNCYEQQLPAAYGGGVQPIYFAPVIKDEKINDELKFMRHVKALITVKSSPVELKGDVLETHGLDGAVVFSSSDQSWEMSGRIDLSPWAMQPPTDPEQMQSFPLAALITGEFPSHFAGKPVPEKPEPEDETAGEEPGETGAPEAAAAQPAREPAAGELTGEGAVIDQGRPGMLFVLASSEVLRNNVIDEEGRGTSATFVMNVIDHLNGRDAYAEMRGKSQRFNPLRDTAPGVKTFVKTLNIAGLPVIVVACGVVVWALRSRRKRAIQAIFGG
ncbi:MAG: Gldg family protein, partial [Candidatus Krumholzibacteria bacterium]|nr:Gldg family protein [Candidatus Krumholzibacteria bacterium]